MDDKMASTVGQQLRSEIMIVAMGTGVVV
jgi:hypothetical protein